MDLQSLLKALNEAPVKEHRFWNTQPVNITTADSDGPIEENVKVRPEPYPLPAPYRFCSVDLRNDQVLQEVYRLLRDNYVEDVDSQFRFEYTPEFLKWALMAPNYNQEWHVGVESSNNAGRLVAFIAAVPCSFRVRGSTFSGSVEVNFLCISKPLRSKRLAPMLIREVTRRVNVAGIFQAIYTAGIPLPAPTATAQYFHRPLRVRELIDSGFCPPGTIDYPIGSSALKLRPVTRDDLPAVMRLVEDYLSKFDLAVQFGSEEEAAHWLLPRPGILYSFVTEEVDAFVSFYSIPTAVLDSPQNPLQVAYLSYYAPAGELLVLPLIKAALQAAHNEGFHVFNALDVMDNTEELLKALRFGKGDGQLRYYLYNWGTALIPANRVGFIML